MDTSNSSSKLNVQKPCLKWVGGKTQILGPVISKFPNVMNNYHEIFLGGGSVLLALLSLQKEGKIKIRKKIYANDSNKGLINVFKSIQQDPSKLYECISSYVSIYDKIIGNIINRKPDNMEEAQSSKESYYFWLRNRFNEFVIDKNITSIEHAAMFMFLNKTGFRGMYREGPKGFNVPFGHYKTTPTIVTQEDLMNISELIKNVIFTCQDFEDSMAIVKKGDFVYLDPPYVPENASSFVKYNVDGFNFDTHKRLFHNVHKIRNKGSKFVLNNANVELVNEEFKDFTSEVLETKRAINCKNPGSTTTEIIIYM